MYRSTNVEQNDDWRADGCPRVNKYEKIGIALKDDNFRKIQLKLFGLVKYHQNLRTLPQISIPSHFPLTRRHDVLLPPLARPTAFFLLSLASPEPRRERGRLRLHPSPPWLPRCPSPLLPRFPSRPSTTAGPR